MILEPKLAIKKEIRGNKRGPYKQRVMRLDGRHVRLGEGVCVQFDGEQYLELQNGNMLPEVWQDIYEWYAGGVAPKEWIEKIARTVPETFLGNDRVREQYTPLV